MKELLGINSKKSIIKVRHNELTQIGGSLYRSECPECKKGVLMVTREMKEPFRLLDFDRCLLCNQLFQYVDILTMRKNEGNE